MSVPKILDLNHNGIEDYKEPFFYLGVWSIAKTLVRVFCPPHTLVRRGVEAVDAALKAGQ